MNANEAEFQRPRIEFGANVFLDLVRNDGSRLLWVVYPGDIDRNPVVANGCQGNLVSLYVSVFGYRNRPRAVGPLFSWVKGLWRPRVQRQWTRVDLDAWTVNMTE